MTVTSQAIATQGNHPAVVLQQKYATRIAGLVPSHVNGDMWVRMASGTLRDPKLCEAAMANFDSFLQEIERAAVLGLRPGSEEFYLQPRKVKGKLQVQGIIGYQGLVDLMYRAGAVASVVVEVVREKDVFRYTPGRDEIPVHEIDWDSDDRGPLRLCYAYAKMTSGSYSKVVVINKAKMYSEHRAKSEGYIITDWNTKEKKVNPNSPWVVFEESMWLKTGARQLSKWVPTSTEYISQRRRAEVTGSRAPVDISGATILDDDVPPVVTSVVVDGAATEFEAGVPEVAQEKPGVRKSTAKSAAQLPVEDPPVDPTLAAWNKGR